MKFFDPWIGSDYKTGIDGNTIFAVGAQHWCDPKYWHCDKTSPHECLEKCDKTCTVWNKKEYEKNEKCNAWVDEDNKTMPMCPLSLVDEKSKYHKYKCRNGKREDCLTNGFRFLHCETKIAVFDHIDNREKVKRSQVFVCIKDALTSLFDKSLDKSEYFDRIIFANYIQHYTHYRYGRLDSEELQLESQKDKEGFKNNLKKFDNGKPDIIIVLQEEMILKEVEDIVKDDYVHITEIDDPKIFYVLVRKSSQFYKENYRETIEGFIQKETKEINDKYEENSKTEVSRGIAILVFFIKELPPYKGISLKELTKKIVDSCSEKIKKLYYKNGEFKYDSIRYFRSKKAGKVGKPITDEEMKKIENKYIDYMKKK